jgi:hypothetical protein
MLRTQKIRCFKANDNRAHRCASPPQTTAGHLPSPIQRRHRVSRQLQLPTGTRLKTTVAKNASRDTTRLATPRVTPSPISRDATRSEPAPFPIPSPFCRDKTHSRATPNSFPANNFPPPANILSPETRSATKLSRRHNSPSGRFTPPLPAPPPPRQPSAESPAARGHAPSHAPPSPSAPAARGGVVPAPASSRRRRAK